MKVTLGDEQYNFEDLCLPSQIILSFVVIIVLIGAIPLMLLCILGVVFITVIEGIRRGFRRKE